MSYRHITRFFLWLLVLTATIGALLPSSAQSESQPLPLPQAASRDVIPLILNGGFETAGSGAGGAQNWKGTNLRPADKRVCTTEASSHGNCGFRFNNARQVNIQRSITQTYNPSKAFGNRDDQLFFGYAIKILTLTEGTSFTVTARIDYINKNLEPDIFTRSYTTPLALDSFIEEQGSLTLKGRADKITVTFRMSKTGVGRVFVDQVTATLLTNIPTVTPTFTPTDTPTNTDTPTLTPSDTATHTPTNTDTPTLTPSDTATNTPTNTDTLTLTPSETPMPTITLTPSPNFTVVLISTESTIAPTPTPTSTWNITASPTYTDTGLYVPSRTPTMTYAPTQTPTITETPTNTFTPSTPPPTAPIALNDEYEVRAHIPITMTAGSLTINDSLGLPAATMLAVTGTTAHGGDYTINADGSFTYFPPPDFTGVDSFEYTLSNAVEDTATVILNVGGAKIWFVNENVGQTRNLGTLADPFTNLLDFQSTKQANGVGPSADEHVYLVGKPSNYEYQAPIVLETNMQLHGSIEGAMSLIAPLPNGSWSLPISPLNRAFIGYATFGDGYAILLSTGNVVDSITIADTWGIGIMQRFSSVSPLQMTNIAKEGQGCFLSLQDTNGTGEVIIEVDSIAITTQCSNNSGISLRNIANGEFTVNGTTTMSAPLYIDNVDTVTFNQRVMLTNVCAWAYLPNIGGNVAFNGGFTISNRDVECYNLFHPVHITNLTGTIHFSDFDIKGADNQPALYAMNSMFGGRLSIDSGTLQSQQDSAMVLQNLAVDINLDSVTTTGAYPHKAPVFQQGLLIENFVIWILNWQ